MNYPAALDLAQKTRRARCCGMRWEATYSAAERRGKEGTERKIIGKKGEG